jgi:hypothetical protein
MTALRRGLIGHGEDKPPGGAHIPAQRPAPGLPTAA